MKNFKVLNKYELRNLSMDELRSYYKEYREYCYETNLDIKNINLRKKAYAILRSGFSFKRIIIRQKLTILNDKRNRTNRPIIYAINHNGKYDIEIMAEALKDHTYILMGDPEQLYLTLDDLFLNMIGVVYLEVDDQKDSNLAKETVIKLLNNNVNIMWYP